MTGTMLPRRVEPELLDDLPAEDPRALRSRRDLRRVNWMMGNTTHLRDALDRLPITGVAPHLVELGAGDGRLMLQLARQLDRRWSGARVTMIDRQPSVSTATRAEFHDIGIDLEVITSDVFDWFAQPVRAADTIVIANLFLHHFAEPELYCLLQATARRARALVCCEPRRSRTALVGSHLLGLMGCNAVTRHDAVISVHAGFRDQELSALWPVPAADAPVWQLYESAAGAFSHCFVASRAA